MQQGKNIDWKTVAAFCVVVEFIFGITGYKGPLISIHGPLVVVSKAEATETRNPPMEDFERQLRAWKPSPKSSQSAEYQPTVIQSGCTDGVPSATGDWIKNVRAIPSTPKSDSADDPQIDIMKPYH